MNSRPDKQRYERHPFREARARSARKARRGSIFGSLARFFLLLIFGGVALGAGVAAQAYLFYTQNLPSIEKLKHYEPSIVSEFYSVDGELIGDFAYQRRYLVPIEQIPKKLQNAFVSAEDKNFWHHKGLDKEAIARAIIQNIRSGKIVVGASTITQQVAKTFLLTPERTFTRKIKEAILSVRIEEALSKKQILYLYLNQIFLGSTAYGVEAAARTYFGKSVNELTLGECAMLGGLAKAPSKKSPKNDLKAALERRAYVLKRMLEDGYLTEEQRDKALNEEPKLVERTNAYKTAAADFTEHVRKYVVKKYGADALYKSGLKVYTTVDLKLTEAAQTAMNTGLRELDKRQGYRGPIETLNVKGIVEFLQEKTREREEPLRFGDITDGVVTQIDDRHIYVAMGSYLKGDVKREYVGKILIDPSPSWWVRKPYIRPEMRTRNFNEGDLPFQVGDRILVRVVDPNVRRRELYLKRYGRTDPEMKNYKVLPEDALDYFPLEPEQEPRVESALMLRENRTGYVRVLLGGRSFEEGKFNRATQARRQPGSSFKPVIYAAALNKGFTCADPIVDAPYAVTIPGTGEVWRPKNYRGGFQGTVSFREAIVKSLNIPTIKILYQTGVDNAIAYAKKLGYTSPLTTNLTLALGSSVVSLEEQVNAYSVFPNRGYLIPGVYVKKIVDRHGKILEEHSPPALLEDSEFSDQPQIRQASHDPSTYAGIDRLAEQNVPILRRQVDEGTAFIMTDLLQDVVQSGTATILKKIVGRPDIAGKTGTTNDNIDAWFVGFSPVYTCGVWVGFDDEFSIGQGETGGKAAAPIWGYFMKEVLRSKEVREFPDSKAVEFRRVDPATGLISSSNRGIEEVFKVGSGPAESDRGLIKGARWDYSGTDLDQF